MISKQPFGRTEHESTRVIFGAAAFGDVSQDVADRTMEQIAAELNVSRSSVSRLLAYAREIGLVEITVHSPQQGSSAVARRVAERYGLSRTPVREVFWRLGEDGFLRVVPQVGTWVAPINVPHLRSCVSVLALLEPQLEVERPLGGVGDETQPTGVCADRPCSDDQRQAEPALPIACDAAEVERWRVVATSLDEGDR